MYFKYGEKETSYLKAKDARLGAVIDTIGHIYRHVDTDLFTSVIHHIIGQQISSKAQKTIWQRLNTAYGEITPAVICHATEKDLQSLGMTFRKASYILDFAVKVEHGELELTAVKNMSDAEAICALSKVKGIGAWTAEMILLFCLERPNILSYNDLAIIRGMRMVYHHRKINRTMFEKYRRRLSPYCSVASLYFWAVAGGAIPGMKDYTPKKDKIAEKTNDKK